MTDISLYPYFFNLKKNPKKRNAVYYLGVHQNENLWLKPKIMKHLAEKRIPKSNAGYRSFSFILPIFSPLHKLNKFPLVVLFKKKKPLYNKTVTFRFGTFTGKLPCLFKDVSHGWCCNIL